MRSIFAILLVAATVGCEGPPGAPGSVVVVQADDDTFVHETLAGDNSAEPFLEVASISPQRWGYAKFELKGFGDVLVGSLRFYAKLLSGTHADLRVYGIVDDGWDGDTLAWDGRPDPDVLLGTVEVTSLGTQYHAIDLSSWLSEQRREAAPAGEVPQASFVFVVSSGSAPVSISSREEPDEPPTLVIVPF